MRMNKKKEIVPKLRFPEFGTSEGWKKYKLRELADRITKKVGDNKLVTLSISAGIGFVSQAEKFSRDISGKQYCNYIYLKKGEFSYNKGNSKTFPQGCIYELKEYDEAAVPNAFISFRFKENLVPSFYQGYFDSNFHGKQLVRFITSGARSDGLLNISPTDFFSIVFPSPVKKEEQQKIADCLSSIDELIDAESRKLKALEKYKKGLLQKLFPAEGKTMPEWRFPEFQGCGEWNIDKLGNLCKITTGKLDANAMVANGKYRFYTCAKEFFQIDKYAFNTEALLISGNGANVGYIHYYKGKFNAYQRTYVLDQFYEDIHYIQYYLERNLSRRINTEKNEGNTPYIVLKTLTDMDIFFPKDLKEQQKIADCLSEVDTMIEEQSNKVEQLKAHKKGLMQGLFPSLEEADV